MSTLTMRRLMEYVLDALFPASCMQCRAPKHPLTNPHGQLCSACLAKIPISQWLFCPWCNRKLVGLTPCKTHAGPLKALGVATNYDHPVVKALVWEYKYRFTESLAEPLSALACQYLRSALFQGADGDGAQWRIAYIPLSPRRQRWRGFNQARLLAERIGEHFAIPVTAALTRTAFRTPQMQILEKKQRFANVKNVFALSPGADVKGRTILLIDDIAASGATLIEAARTLKRAGAKAVYGFVIARSQ